MGAAPTRGLPRQATGHEATPVAVARAGQRPSELMELLIHEQYFRQELEYCQSDIQEKVTRSLQWVTERGYEPAFWGEGFLGNRG